jgi:uncharacterized protein (UPF0264 family)
MSFANAKSPIANSASACRPRLLVSVRDAAEAGEALAGGADWIDLKDPARGPLGAVALAAAEEVARALRGSGVPLSAACGELRDAGPSLQELTLLPEVVLVKLGLASCRGVPWKAEWRRASREVVSGGREIAAVAYLDAEAAASPTSDEVLDAASEGGSTWLLCDTFDKRGPGTIELAAETFLPQLLRRARSNGLKTAVAGRLRRESLRRLPLDLIDVVAVRGAACRESREGPICRDLVRDLRVTLETLCARVPRGEINVARAAQRRPIRSANSDFS